MKTITLQAKRWRIISLLVPIAVVGTLLARVLAQGLLHPAEVQSTIIGSLIGSFIAALLLPLKRHTVILTESTLQAPVRKGLWLQPVTVNLSKIVLSRNFTSWLIGSQISIRDGDTLRIYPPFHSTKAIRHLFDEIEKRQQTLNTPNHRLHSIAGSARSE
jgi:uncharacterized membrane protein